MSIPIFFGQDQLYLKQCGIPSSHLLLNYCRKVSITSSRISPSLTLLLLIKKKKKKKEEKREESGGRVLPKYFQSFIRQLVVSQLI